MDELRVPRRQPSVPPPIFVSQRRDRPPPLPRSQGSPTSLWQETLEEHRDPMGEGGGASIGGPLILMAIGRVLAVPIMFFSLVHLLQVYSMPGLWAKLTSPSSPNYHPMWATAIFYEVGGKAALFLWSVVLVWLFFSRKKALRFWFIAYSVLQLAYLWSDHFIAAMLLHKSAFASPEQLGRLIGVSLSTMIWVPYFVVSERVRETFVK